MNAGEGKDNMNIVRFASKLTNAFITFYRTPRQGSGYGYLLPSNYIYKKWNYFYNPMVYREINDGPWQIQSPYKEEKDFKITHEI